MACPEFFYSVMKICHGRKLLVRIFLSSNCSEITYQKWKNNKILWESKFNLYLTCFNEKVCVIFQQKQSFPFKIFLILRSLHASMFIQGETSDLWIIRYLTCSHLDLSLPFIRSFATWHFSHLFNLRHFATSLFFAVVRQLTINYSLNTGIHRLLICSVI